MKTVTIDGAEFVRKSEAVKRIEELEAQAKQSAREFDAATRLLRDAAIERDEARALAWQWQDRCEFFSAYARSLPSRPPPPPRFIPSGWRK